MASQAYATAGQAVGSVAGVVGLGSGGGATETQAKGATEREIGMKDERIDGMKDEAVEEYLRGKVSSTAQGKA